MLQTEIMVTSKIAAEHGLTAGEYERIKQILGREPNITELGIFSVMWSEHCSYKSSKVHLKRLPVRGARVVQGPGENAGVVDIGDGWVAAFKMESHNHPSFVEPFQGAATGVGGILRDIFTMGARPIAVMDALRFGEITKGPGNGDQGSGENQGEILRFAPLGCARGKQDDKAGRVASEEEIKRNRRILDGVIGGIAFYGNCFGVPTVGGEVQFESSYAGNPLVNVLALGVARREELFFAKARGTGNPVIYVGAKTGRDGIHGASLLASAEFTEESQQKRPNVQVGDPFMEKLLLEACLEAMRTGAVVAIQDMGAAGLTCSTCEMGSRGGTGIEIELAKVPQRETGMTPYEIMLSESQERMLLVAERGREAEVLGVFAKWGLDAVVIGAVTGDGLLRVRQHGNVVAEIPAHPLAEEGPVYQRPMRAPAPRKDERWFEFAAVGATGRSPVGHATNALTENFKKLLASPAIASKRWIFEQYDHMVRTNTLVAPGAGDAAVVRVKGTESAAIPSGRALALATDCNGRWCSLNPREGAKAAVAEAARNIACSGARPIAATNCLNFGNPEKPETMWQFSEVIDGIAEACAALDTPITGGNVSFCNETLGKPVFPTPTMGILGILEDASKAMGMGFRDDGDAIVLLDGKVDSQQSIVDSPDQRAAMDYQLSTMNSFRHEFSSSEYAKRIYGIVAGSPPAADLAAERRLIEALVKMASESAIRSAHDVSDGGIAVTIAESCFASNGLSAQVRLEGRAPVEYALFGERGARAVVSCTPGGIGRVEAIARECGVSAGTIGTVGRGEFRIEYNGRAAIAADVAALRDEWASSLERALKQ
ncbi:MAG: phosphoribosylformylglycinamidine synthase subunit PurL [Acidobacteria bacterium]|nr:phosphoribosylformylglycinamidine synthase subunit PurL [Acidobacteriota bacterium]